MHMYYAAYFEVKATRSLLFMHLGIKGHSGRFVRIIRSVYLKIDIIRFKMNRIKIRIIKNL